MKQTAVEWLVDELLSGNLLMPSLIEQAKEMEKQQIINTWYDCKLSIIDKNPTDAEQYYKETFKN
jgi:hypothetical protein